MFHGYDVCIENGSEDDERKELINSLSDSHEVHRDADLQGN